MPLERPFMTARWTDLVMLNFAVPEEVIAAIAPAGTETDTHDGQAYISVVGFMFHDARMFGLGFPGHKRFEEVNLRYYVRRQHGEDVRRGVVFVQEIAPRPMVAAVARWVYNESYVTMQMRHDIRRTADGLALGDEIAYGWQTGRRRTQRWNRVATRVASVPDLPPVGSLDEFIVEHYWAYARGRDGLTWEYRVAHRPWRVARAEDVVWDCDVAATYANAPLGRYLTQRPVSALIADGSPVQVFRGRRCDAAPITSAAVRRDRPVGTRCAAFVP